MKTRTTGSWGISVIGILALFAPALILSHTVCAMERGPIGSMKGVKLTTRAAGKAGAGRTVNKGPGKRHLKVKTPRLGVANKDTRVKGVERSFTKRSSKVLGVFQGPGSSNTNIRKPISHSRVGRLGKGLIPDLPGGGRIPDLNDIAEMRRHQMDSAFKDSVFGALDMSRIPGAGGPDREEGSTGGPEGWHGPDRNTHTRNGVSVTLLHDEATVITPGGSGTGGGNSGWGGEGRNTYTSESSSTTLGDDDAVVIQKKNDTDSGGKNDGNDGGSSSGGNPKDDSGKETDKGAKEKQVMEKVDKGNDPDGGDDPEELKSWMNDQSFQSLVSQASAGGSGSGNDSGGAAGSTPERPDGSGWDRHRANLNKRPTIPEDGRPDEMLNPMGARTGVILNNEEAQAHSAIIGDTGIGTNSLLNVESRGYANQPAPGEEDPGDPRASERRTVAGTGFFSNAMSPSVDGNGKNPDVPPGPEF